MCPQLGGECGQRVVRISSAALLVKSELGIKGAAGVRFYSYRAKLALWIEMAGSLWGSSVKTRLKSKPRMEGMG